MKIKALITTLVLGSSSLALANPSWSGGVNVRLTYGQPTYGQQVAVRDLRSYEPAPLVRDHRDRDRDRDQNFGQGWNDIRPIVAPVVQPGPRWFELAQASTVRNSLSQVFEVPGATGDVRELKLVAESGKTRIAGITIQFTDGTVQHISGITLDMTRYPEYTFTLAGRCRVARIIVHGTSAYGSQYSLLAA